MTKQFFPQLSNKAVLKPICHLQKYVELFSQIVTAAPQKFKIDILPVDDGTPRIVTNLGLQWLEYMENKVRGFLLLVNHSRKMLCLCDRQRHKKKKARSHFDQHA